jgi:DNA-binding NarL/FixJ family response regulator
MAVSVYIADDHAVVRDGLRALLEANPDIKVVGDAANGRLAVSQVQALQPDVVLMDISMPELNGIDATRQILQSSPQTRVIILSILGTPEHVFRALQAGARGYLLKESAGREVMEAVLSVHTGQTYLSQPITDTLISDYLLQRGQGREKGPLERLSQREREILLLVVQGRSSADIGASLHLSPKTVESYRSRMMQKLGVSDLASLIKFAIQQGLISLD